MMLHKTDYSILSAVVVSLAISMYLWINGDHQSALFLALWVPTLLGLGHYLKRPGVNE